MSNAATRSMISSWSSVSSNITGPPADALCAAAARRSRTGLGPHSRPGDRPADLRDRPDTSAALHRSGDVWTVTFAGRRVALRASKRIETLAELLAAAGRELHCL